MKRSVKTVIIAALAANLLIAVTKFLAAWWTGSSAILSEGVHSLVDSGNQVLLLHGQRRAALPPDQNFPFGHGKEIYFWSFVVSILVFALGAGVSLYEGISHLLGPSRLEHVFVNHLVLATAILFEGVSWTVSLREFRRGKRPGEGYLAAIRHAKDPSLFMVLMEDSAALLGLLVALAGIEMTRASGNPVFDGGASLVIALILAGTAILLAVETKGLLVGEAARGDVVQRIREIVAAGRHVEHVNEVLTLHMGPDYIVTTISLDFADEVPVGELEETVLGLETQIKEKVPDVKKVFIEAQAWRRPQGRTPRP